MYDTKLQNCHYFCLIHIFVIFKILKRRKFAKLWYENSQFSSNCYFFYQLNNTSDVFHEHFGDPLWIYLSIGQDEFNTLKGLDCNIYYHNFLPLHFQLWRKKSGAGFFCSAIWVFKLMQKYHSWELDKKDAFSIRRR